MLLNRFVLGVCALSLSAVACAPQPNATPSTPSEQTQAQAMLSTDVILTQEVQGIENPITPEQIQSIKVGNRVIQRGEIEVVTGDFSTQQANEGDFKVQYLWEANGSLNVGVFRFLSQFGAVGKIEITYLKDGQPTTFSFVAGGKTTGAATTDNLRITVKEDGTIVGGIANPEGVLDTARPVFRTTTDQKLEVIEPGGQKTVFNLGVASDTEADLEAESTGTATDEDKAGFEVDGISPINLFVGNWQANLLGKKINASLSDAGNGKVTGSATVDGKTYSASGDYSISASQPNRLQLTGQGPAGNTLNFQAELLQKNTLTLKMLNAGGIAELQPFVNIPVPLKRAL